MVSLSIDDEFIANYFNRMVNYLFVFNIVLDFKGRRLHFSKISQKFLANTSLVSVFKILESVFDKVRKRANHMLKIRKILL